MQNNKLQKSDNYLDYIPKHSEEYESYVDEKGIVTILVENKGIFNRVAQKILKKPKVSKIHLDEMGSFIWKHIDGENSVYDISEYVKEEFKEKAEPLYNRLVKYMQTLEAYGFISFVKSK